MPFTAAEIAKCRAAMDKPAPIEALRLIASGRAIVELTQDKRDVLIDSFDGKLVRDGERKMGLSGAWPLYRAGMIDDFGRVTELGLAMLAAAQ